MDIAVKAIGGRVPVICGVMDTSTQRVIQNIEVAEQFGVDAVAATPGYYYPSTDDADLIEFYFDVAVSTNLLFSFTTSLRPSRQMIKPYIVAQLAETCENIVGIKDSFRRLDKLPRPLGTARRQAGFLHHARFAYCDRCRGPVRC